MSVKRPSLADSMRLAADPAADAPFAPTPAPLPPSRITSSVRPIPVAEPGTRPAGFYAATRVGKKKVTAALDPAAHKQLKNLGTDLELTTEALLTEAINDLFKKHGKPTIA